MQMDFVESQGKVREFFFHPMLFNLITLHFIKLPIEFILHIRGQQLGQGGHESGKTGKNQGI